MQVSYRVDFELWTARNSVAIYLNYKIIMSHNYRNCVYIIGSPILSAMTQVSVPFVLKFRSTF